MSEPAFYVPEGHVGGDGLAPSGPGGPERAVAQPALGVGGWVRWVWRQLTSMRVALLLLMLLAIAALPGSFFPQRPQAPERVARYLADHPGPGEWLDRLGFFDVYAAPWFAAIYLLLFVSLVGCILPRSAAHLRALRAEPPRVPRSFDRFQDRGEVIVEASPESVEQAVLASLRRRFRVRTGYEAGDSGSRLGSAAGDVASGGPAVAGAQRTVRAERGYLRESGNLLFHLALVGVLVSVALGQLLSYRGQAIVVEGRGFANAVVDYDSFESGTWFRDGDLEPFSLTLERFESDFDPLTLRPRDFTAFVTVTGDRASPRAATIKVNHPLQAGGARVYLSGNGYAPGIEVRDGAGQVAFSGAVPFLPQDAVYTSRGVVKVPDVSAGQPQLGFVGFLLPSAVVEESGARSVFPQPVSPLLVLTLYEGDLGLDDGVPQNAYELETSAMTRVNADDGDPLTLFLELGETAQLPDGRGSVTFASLPRFVALDLRHDPAVTAVLAFSLLAMLGLATSLFVPRRRLWARLTPLPDGRTRVSVAALARGDDPGLQGEVERVLRAAGTAMPSFETPPLQAPPSFEASPSSGEPPPRDVRRQPAPITAAPTRADAPTPTAPTRGEPR